MSTITLAHIELDESGVAWVTGSNTKVIEIVVDKLANGSSPEEIHFQHPHLSLSQIHAALAYYYDNQAEIDYEIEKQLQDLKVLQSENSDSPLRTRLRAQGLIP